MPKRRRKREQPMMHPSCRPQQQPQHFLWGCIMRCKVRYAPLRALEPVPGYYEVAALRSWNYTRTLGAEQRTRWTPPQPNAMPGVPGCALLRLGALSARLPYASMPAALHQTD